MACGLLSTLFQLLVSTLQNIVLWQRSIKCILCSWAGCHKMGQVMLRDG